MVQPFTGFFCQFPGVVCQVSEGEILGHCCLVAGEFETGAR